MGTEDVVHSDGIRCVQDSDGREALDFHEDGSGDVDIVDERYREWLRALEEDVIQGEYGYEPGEFTVYPSLWRPLFDEGLAPGAAWHRALEAFGEQRRKDEREKQENWERIQREEAKYRVGEGA